MLFIHLNIKHFNQSSHSVFTLKSAERNSQVAKNDSSHIMMVYKIRWTYPLEDAYFLSGQ